MLSHRRAPDIIAFFLFVCYIAIGLSIVGDFGVNWDDAQQRGNGLNNIDYLFYQHKEPLRHSADRYHGPAFEIVLVLLEKILHPRDEHPLYIMRHTAVFIYTALCLVAFYFALRRLFTHQWLPLLGCLFFVLHPRIFADTFYNPKDITAMGGMMVGLLTLILFARRPSWWILILHAFISAWCIDIRVICVLVPLATACIFLYQRLWVDRVSLPGTAVTLGLYLLLTFAFMIPMWPILIDAPFYHLSSAVTQMSHFTLWNYPNLYFGHQYSGTSTPGAYQFVWFLLTTPVLYTILFIIGLCRLLVSVRDWRTGSITHVYIWMSLGLFFIPPAAMWILHSVVLEGWRHVFLIYPFFIVVCVFAIDSLLSHGLLLRRVTWAILIGGLGFNACMQAYMHPFGYTYFNPLSAYCLAPLDTQFEIDYWGPSFKQGFEYLLQTTPPGTPLRIAVNVAPGLFNRDFLPAYDRARIEIVDVQAADYYLTSHRWEHHPQPDDKLLYEFKRQGNRIMSIYRLR